MSIYRPAHARTPLSDRYTNRGRRASRPGPSWPAGTQVGSLGRSTSCRRLQTICTSGSLRAHATACPSAKIQLLLGVVAGRRRDPSGSFSESFLAAFKFGAVRVTHDCGCTLPARQPSSHLRLLPPSPPPTFASSHLGLAIRMTVTAWRHLSPPIHPLPCPRCPGVTGQTNEAPRSQGTTRADSEAPYRPPLPLRTSTPGTECL
jgi:hypothetical protein